MTALLEQALERVRTLPAELQDEYARILLRLTGDDDAVYQLSPGEEADLIEAEAEVRRGEIATDAAVSAVFSKYRN
ncbi:hypothetical protein GTW51_10560 [Aurantimonas aggregata]|uniref:Addiction module protein n=1 Tax=Aurantimonas aggregata TaxID=2047720 RepID=A0A6L9MHV9_9HYPH|nr:hypothetical protein [Aurantimonas aggregata]NDV87142.1 hypothetical protein [Aurantimonas aggregata]